MYNRPSRMESLKEEKYHCDYADWIIDAMHCDKYNSFISNGFMNWCFYKGREHQWIFEEDMAGFFLDETGNPRHRIKMSWNLIKPIVNFYTGNIVRSEFRFKAESMNDLVKNKLDDVIERLFSYHDIIDKFPEFEKGIRERVPLGKNKFETEELVRNSPVDEVSEAMNNMINILSDRVDMDKIKIRATKNMAIWGVAAYSGEVNNLQYRGKYIHPSQLILDFGAKEPDFSDASFIGYWDMEDASSIAEKYQLTSTELEKLENYSKNNFDSPTMRINNYMNVFSPGNIPIMRLYWKDYSFKEIGWVKDDMGYIGLEVINEEGGKFKTSDLVSKKDLTEEQLSVTGGKTSKNTPIEEIRYIILSPKEIIGASENGNHFVYEYGILDFQEEDKLMPESVKFPIKIQTYDYELGDILTPLDDVIDPQRLLNRLISISESHFNLAHGSGTIIAADAIDDEDGDIGISSKMSRGETITIDATKYGSVHNAISEYRTNVGDVPNQISPFIALIKNSIDSTTSVNDSMKGTQSPSNALVGVVRDQINQGTMVQEPFFYSISKFMQQVTENIAQVGRKVYSKYPKMLSLMAGDRAKDILVHIESMSLESWRISVERGDSKATEIDKANNLIFMLLQYQLIDQHLASKLLGKSDTNLVFDQMEKYQGQLAIAKEEKAKQESEIEAAQNSVEANQVNQQMVQQTDQIEEGQQQEKSAKMLDYLKSSERNSTSIERDLLKLYNNNQNN